MYIYIAEPLVPVPSPLQVENVTVRKKMHKSPDIYQIPAKLIQAGGKTLHSEIHELINSIWSKEELPDQWKKSIIPVYGRAKKLTVVITYFGISLLSASYKILFNILISRLSPHR
jgi:predicted nucleic acid-binding protein